MTLPPLRFHNWLELFSHALRPTDFSEVRCSLSSKALPTGCHPWPLLGPFPLVATPGLSLGSSSPAGKWHPLTPAAQVLQLVISAITSRGHPRTSKTAITVLCQGPADLLFLQVSTL